MSVVADGADALAGGDLVADLHVDRSEVAAHRVVVLAVIDDHEAAVRAVAIGERDAPAKTARTTEPRVRRDLEARALRAFAVRGADLGACRRRERAAGRATPTKPDRALIAPAPSARST